MGRKGLVATAVALAAIGLLYGCVSTRLPNVALQVTGEAARPAVLAAFAGDPPVTTAQEWTERRAPVLREAFQTNIYGRFPEARTATVTTRETLDAPAFAGVGVLEQWDVALGGLPDGRGFSMVVVVPSGAQGPLPVIVMENFCGNASVYPEIAGIRGPRNGSPAECRNSLMRPIVSMIFGNAVLTPPTAEILNAGYALAMLYGGDVVPDDAETAEPFLQELTPAGTPPEQRSGAIAVWAWTYQRALDVLALDPRFDPHRMALWGHSRNGKAALLAAAFDPRPAAVIALQAGTAGGSLGHDEVGEGIAEITSTYPHWFAPAYARYAGRQAELPVDQHQLLGLIAPRSVLLAGGRRDQWSDPIGAVRAAAGASPVYELFGIAPFAQTDLLTGDFSRPLATYMRPGLHGVHKSDWREIIAFLDAQMPARP